MKTQVLGPSPADWTGRALQAPAALFLASHRNLLVLLPYLGLRALQLHFVAPNSDVRRYFDAANLWFSGAVPYSDFLLEYPPGALIWGSLARVLTADFGRFGHLFAAQMVAVDLGILYLLAHLPARLAGHDSADAVPRGSPLALQLTYDGSASMLLYLGLSALLVGLSFERFDALLALCLLGFLSAAAHARRPLWADAWLCLGIWIKLVPALVVPLYVAYLWASRPAAPPATPLAADLRAWLRHSAAPRLLSLLGISALLWLPFYAGAGDGLWTFLRYHQVRGLQLESLYASLLMLAHHLAPSGLHFVPAFGAAEMMHPWRALITGLATLSTCLTLGAALWIAVWAGRRMRDAADASGRAQLLATGVFAQMLAMIALNKVLSPQYLLWLAPLCPIACLDDHRRRRHVALGIGVATLLTTLLWNFYYRNMLTFDPMAVALLLSRNGLLLATLAVTLQRQPFLAAPAAAAPAPAPKGLGQRLVAALDRPLWHAAALGLCALWIVVANLSETTANDIWIQMRSGADIWQSGSFPKTEVYSATVLNRHFIAHEWLTSVIFHGLVSAFGAAGLSFLAAGVALAVALLIYFSQPRAERHTLPYLALWLTTMYLVSFRILVRPHIFTIVAQACMLYVLEAWRRDGKHRRLWVLLPLQLVWINLHGAAFFGPALMFMMAGLVALLAVVPALQRGSEPRRLGAGDAAALGGVGVAMSLGCLCNPYGTDLLRFSIDLFNNEYAKSRVWEWTTPFLPTNFSYYWLWLYMAVLALLWLSVAVRYKSLPVLDFALATLVTYLSTRANRFVPDFAIFAFPVIHRSLQQVGRAALGSFFCRPQPFVALGLATLLFTNATTYGYAHSAGEHRPLLGWGFGGDMPYQEVDLIKKMQLRGVIFNEYSDGSLIIHSLVPQVRPVLDSRIDLYPLDFVDEYDRAYVSPAHFARFAKKHRVNLVMLMVARASPDLLRYLQTNPMWQLLAQINGRVLYRKRSDGPLSTAGVSY